MKYDYLVQSDEYKKTRNGLLITVCGMAVQLVFADKSNAEIPELVGSILKDSYLQRQSA